MTKIAYAAIVVLGLAALAMTATASAHGRSTGASQSIVLKISPCPDGFAFHQGFCLPVR